MHSPIHSLRQTDTQFNGLLSRTTSSQYWKGYTHLDFNEARHHGVAVASAEPYASLHLSPEIMMTATHHSNFYKTDALPDPQPTVENQHTTPERQC